MSAKKNFHFQLEITQKKCKHEIKNSCGMTWKAFMCSFSSDVFLATELLSQASIYISLDSDLPEDASCNIHQRC